MSRPLLPLLPLLLASWLMGCTAKAPAPTTPTPTTFELPKLDFAAIATLRQVRAASQEQLERGQQCGWQAGWMGTVREARQVAPGEFRSRAVGRAYRWGGVFAVAGFVLTLALAWVLPRLRRRTKSPRPEVTAPSWVDYFKALAMRFVTRCGRLLRVEQFDALLASERQRAIETCREAERQLTVALQSVDAMRAAATNAPAEGPPPPDPQGGTVSPGVDTWRAELVKLRRRLEGPGSLPPELLPDHLAPRLEVTLRAARDLRIAAERGLIQHAGEALWVGLARDLTDRPETPRDRVASVHAALAPWVRVVGHAGIGAMVLALPMLAAWMAAGAFPLFFALLFGLGALGAVLVARVHLHRAGHLPLLPGFADRVVSWLTAVLALTLLVTMLSSWMSTESGLDLGDAPPVAMPDPKLLTAPRLFPETKPATDKPSPTSPFPP